MPRGRRSWAPRCARPCSLSGRQRPTRTLVRGLRLYRRWATTFVDAVLRQDASRCSTSRAPRSRFLSVTHPSASPCTRCTSVVAYCGPSRRAPHAGTVREFRRVPLRHPRWDSCCSRRAPAGGAGRPALAHSPSAPSSFHRRTAPRALAGTARITGLCRRPVGLAAGSCCASSSAEHLLPSWSRCWWSSRSGTSTRPTVSESLSRWSPHAVVTLEGGSPPPTPSINRAGSHGWVPQRSTASRVATSSGFSLARPPAAALFAAFSAMLRPRACRGDEILDRDPLVDLWICRMPHRGSRSRDRDGR